MPTRNEMAHADPVLLPDGDTVLFYVAAGSGALESRVETVSLSTRERKVLIEGGRMARVETPVCDFGVKAPDFSLPGTHGGVRTRDSCRGERGLLVMFICNQLRPQFWYGQETERQRQDRRTFVRRLLTKEDER